MLDEGGIRCDDFERSSTGASAGASEDIVLVGSFVLCVRCLNSGKYFSGNAINTLMPTSPTFNNDSQDATSTDCD